MASFPARSGPRTHLFGLCRLGLRSAEIKREGERERGGYVQYCMFITGGVEGGLGARPRAAAGR